MIVEYIRYSVPAERHEEFVAAYRDAALELDASQHCLGYELSRCHEEPQLYVIRIEWDSLAGHLQGFRSSPEFKSFFAKVRPFFEQIQEMHHYEVSQVAGRKRTELGAPSR
jgi:quinol monooxygenase YgiN